MKKFASLLLTAVLVCTLLSVFVLPASAEEEKTAGEMAEDYMDAGGDLESEGQHEEAADAYLIAAYLYEDADDPDSAAVAYQNAGSAFAKAAELYRDAGNAVAAADAFMKAGECYEKAGNFTNAGVAFSCITNLMNKVNLSSIVVAHAKAGECYEKANDLSNAKNAFGYAARAAQDKADKLGRSAGSILSGGSLVIICSVACLVVGALGMYLIMKKKKPAVAGGENKNEE